MRPIRVGCFNGAIDPQAPFYCLAHPLFEGSKFCPESGATEHGHESLKIAGHSPFDEPILRRYFSLLDCAARTQSGTKQSGSLRGVVETTFSRRIASHSPFDWTGNCTGLPQRRKRNQALYLRIKD